MYGAGYVAPEIIFQNMLDATNDENSGCYTHYYVGIMYRDGFGVEQNDDKAVEFFSRSSEIEGAVELDDLHAMLLQGRGITNSPFAQNQLHSLCQSGSELAQFQLNIHRHKMPVQDALAIFAGVIEKGGPDGPTRLGELANLLCSSKETRDCMKPSELEKYLKRAADELHHHGAEFEYAEICTKTDYRFFTHWLTSPQTIAIDYYLRAARAGHTLAHFKYDEMCSSNARYDGVTDVARKIGTVYLLGDKTIGIQPNLQNAEFFLTRAANEGNLAAAYLLADLLDNKFFQAQMYRQIAIKGNYLPAVLEEKAINGDSEAAFHLYQLLFSGKEDFQLPPNLHKACKYLVLAAKGHVQAHHIAMDFPRHNDAEVPMPILEYQDRNKTMKQLVQAYALADQFDNLYNPAPETSAPVPNPHRQIAIRGRYVPAVLEERAINGDTNSAFLLYLLHRNGLMYQLPVNEKKAVKFLMMAANGGHKEAKEEFIELVQKGKIEGSVSLIERYQKEIKELKKAEAKIDASVVAYTETETGSIFEQFFAKPVPKLDPSEMADDNNEGL